MLVRNKRTGVIGELRESLALAMIKLGKCEEVKKEAIENKSLSSKNKEYKTKDVKKEQI